MPENAPYDKRSTTERVAEARRARDLQNDPHAAQEQLQQQLQEMRQQLTALKAWQDNLQGQGGIDVNGNIISLNTRTGGGTRKNEGDTIRVVIVNVDTGTAEYWDVSATLVGPV